MKLTCCGLLAVDMTIKISAHHNTHKSDKDTSFGWTEDKFVTFIQSARTKLGL